MIVGQGTEKTMDPLRRRLWSALRCRREAELLPGGTGAYYEAAAEAERREEELERLIEALPNSLDRVLLRLRYGQGLPWSRIRAELDGVGCCYSERQLYRLHAGALARAEALLREEDRER
ncbi:MAG: hypothetical protein K6G17_05130 [Oscillospiraceae bacterium]|nr:hypothetical protein [Oscillospiraceae bacterium]